MKANEFRRSDALLVRYRKPREGPPSYLIWEPGKSYICMDSKAVLKAVKWPKYTPTGAALREWMDEVEGSTPQEGETGFATLKDQPQDHATGEPSRVL